MDEQLTDESEANGRTGKSLIGTALSKMCCFKRLDGRNFDFNDKFRFQEINLQHQIIDFNDANKKFDFERLFSVITDDMTVERKGSNSISISFEESPKFMLSTNYVIKNMDNSSNNRQFVVELSNHYNESHTPFGEFGHLLFEDWSKTEWLRFDLFMIKSIQYYLTNDLNQHKVINAGEKNLLVATSPEFVDTMDFIASSNDFHVNKFYIKSDFLQVIKDNSDFESIGKVKLGKWLKVWAKFRGFSIVETREYVEDMLSQSKVRKRGFYFKRLDSVKREVEVDDEPIVC